MAAPIVRDDAEAVLREEKHLTVPSVGAQRPAVRTRTLDAGHSLAISSRYWGHCENRPTRVASAEASRMTQGGHLVEQERAPRPGNHNGRGVLFSY